MVHTNIIFPTEQPCHRIFANNVKQIIRTEHSGRAMLVEEKLLGTRIFK
jgi:hypothetical protein